MNQTRLSSETINNKQTFTDKGAAAIYDLVKKSAYPLILIPERAGADATGAALALFLVLEKIKKNPQIASSEPLDEKFFFLPGIESIRTDISKERLYKISFEVGEDGIKELYYDQEGKFLNIYLSSERNGIVPQGVRMEALKFKHDLVLAIGGESPESFGRVYYENEDLFSEVPVIGINNRASGKKFGTINFTCPECSSVSETVARVAEGVLPSYLDEKIAALLLAGIIDETDNFQSSGIRPEVFLLTASLIAAGANRDEIAARIRQLKSPSVPVEEGKYELPPSGKQIIFLAASMGTVIGLLYLRFPGNFPNSKNLVAFNSALSHGAAKQDAVVSLNEDTVIRAIKTGSSAPAPSPGEEIVGLPLRLTIPSIGVDANIQQAGLTRDDTMESPNNFRDVAWFKLGVKPGEQGNAVIAGHLDTDTGTDAIFWNLHKLVPGDYIYVMNDKNKKLRFQVMESQVYDNDKAPMEEIFGPTNRIRLNLITCDGAWDRGRNAYTKRLVVFSEYAPE